MADGPRTDPPQVAPAEFPAPKVLYSFTHTTRSTYLGKQPIHAQSIITIDHHPLLALFTSHGTVVREFGHRPDPARVHVREFGTTLCGAYAGPGRAHVSRARLTESDPTQQGRSALRGMSGWPSGATRSIRFGAIPASAASWPIRSADVVHCLALHRQDLRPAGNRQRRRFDTPAGPAMSCSTSWRAWTR